MPRSSRSAVVYNRPAGLAALCKESATFFWHMSTAAILAAAIDQAPPETFFSAADFGEAGSPSAVWTAMSRLKRQRRDLVALGAGVYWKGRESRFGSGRPDVVAAVRHRSHGRGLGPTGWLASNALGLSTEVPAQPTLVIVGRPPKGFPGVSFTQRSNLARVNLAWNDVALLEVLRAYPDYVDVSWPDVVRRIRQHVADGAIDLDKVIQAAATDRSAKLRGNLARWCLIGSNV